MGPAAGRPRCIRWSYLPRFAAFFLAGAFFLTGAFLTAFLAAFFAGAFLAALFADFFAGAFLAAFFAARFLTAMLTSGVESLRRPEWPAGYYNIAHFGIRAIAAAVRSRCGAERWTRVFEHLLRDGNATNEWQTTFQNLQESKARC